MRIGILTLPLQLNYGGILQAFALSRTLERLGHTPFVIKKGTKHANWKLPLFLCKRIIKKYVLGQKSTIIFYERQTRKEYPIVSRNIEPFINKNIPQLSVKRFSMINAAGIDAIVVGSDQIWRPRYVKNIKSAYLSFAKSWPIKKISYAASLGTDKWEYSPLQTFICKRLINQFHAISVRENSAVSLLRRHFGIDSLQMPDPTLLLSQSDYREIASRRKDTTHHSGIFSYILDHSATADKIIDAVAQKYGTDIYSQTAFDNRLHIPVEQRVQQSVEQWLQNFIDASFVVTDSFHGTVFSIIFNKPFITTGNKARGNSRFETLLRMFNLNERLITSPDNIDKIIESPIDWESINSMIETYMQKATTYLSDNLK